MNRSPFSLEGKTAIVTGGGTGIGKSIAIEFARAGADVALCSRKLEHLEPVAKEITNLGRRTFAMAVDVRQEDQVKGIIERAASEWGRLDEAPQLIDKLTACAQDNGATFSPGPVFRRIERDLPTRQAEIALPR